MQIHVGLPIQQHKDQRTKQIGKIFLYIHGGFVPGRQLGHEDAGQIAAPYGTPQAEPAFLGGQIADVLAGTHLGHHGKGIVQYIVCYFIRADLHGGLPFLQMTDQEQNGQRQ